jgi:hypothetical protein
VSGADVLRITREDGTGPVSLKLEGRVEGVWVEVLRKTWTESLASSEGSKTIVDLSAVSFADREGRALLLEMKKRGAVLAKASGFMRHVLTDGGDDSDGKGE